jgi:o-succinylbenzoate synthase
MISFDRFSLALTDPLETASGAIERREGFVVRVPFDGQTGLGEATPLPGWTEPLDACRTAMERAADVAAQLDWGIALEKTAKPAARHGLSLALSDARAAATDEPLYRYLGREERVERVPVNATLGDAPVEQTVDKAETAVDEGFETLKLKVGARDVEDDIERVAAVRAAVGERVAVRADANGAWDRDQADRAFDAFADLGVSLVEQPLAPSDLDGHAALRGGPVAVALDESLVEWSVDAVVAAQAADAIVCKPMVLGGPDATYEAAMRARDAGLDVVVTTTVDGVVARTGAVHVAAAIPGVAACGLATADLLAEDLGPDPAPVTGGGIQVPQGPGVGVEL